MGKKPEPPASDVSAKKVIEAKPPLAAAPAPEIAQPLPEEVVRVGAYFRWDAAGRPGGDGIRFWLEAEQELLSGDVSAAEKSMLKR